MRIGKYTRGQYVPACKTVMFPMLTLVQHIPGLACTTFLISSINNALCSGLRDRNSIQDCLLTPVIDVSQLRVTYATAQGSAEETNGRGNHKNDIKMELEDHEAKVHNIVYRHDVPNLSANRNQKYLQGLFVLAN